MVLFILGSYTKSISFRDMYRDFGFPINKLGFRIAIFPKWTNPRQSTTVSVSLIKVEGIRHLTSGLIHMKSQSQLPNLWRSKQYGKRETINPLVLWFQYTSIHMKLATFTTFTTVDWQQKTSGTRGPARGPATECCHQHSVTSPLDRSWEAQKLGCL